MAEKVLTINDKQVKFKITGFTPLMYMSMFQSDFLKDFMAMEKAQRNEEAPDMITFYKIAYCLAKKADEEIPSMENWLDSFEDGFPIAEVLQEIMPLIQLNFSSTAPKKSQAKKK